MSRRNSFAEANGRPGASKAEPPKGVRTCAAQGAGSAQQHMKLRSPETNCTPLGRFGLSPVCKKIDKKIVSHLIKLLGDGLFLYKAKGLTNFEKCKKMLSTFKANATFKKKLEDENAKRHASFNKAFMNHHGIKAESTVKTRKN
jgi:hypothetical protein